MSRKEVIYQGLLDLNVAVEDFLVSSPNYFRISHLPTEFTSGQNVFKFKGNPDTFIEDTPIEIEILDSNGDPIYFESDLDFRVNHYNDNVDLSLIKPAVIKNYDDDDDQ